MSDGDNAATVHARALTLLCIMGLVVIFLNELRLILDAIAVALYGTWEGYGQ